LFHNVSQVKYLVMITIHKHLIPEEIMGKFILENDLLVCNLLIFKFLNVTNNQKQETLATRLNTTSPSASLQFQMVHWTVYSPLNISSFFPFSLFLPFFCSLMLSTTLEPSWSGSSPIPLPFTIQLYSSQYSCSVHSFHTASPLLFFLF